MSFANSHLLWLLLVIPPGLLVFFVWSARTRRNLMKQFIHARLLPGLTAGVSPGREKIRASCVILAAVFLVLALARPQWGYDLEEVRQRGLDIVVAIDTSKSMLAEDIAPNRLARAKYAALDLMQQAKSDRLGLVAFAGTAFLQCPLTIDDSAFRQSVESLDVNTLPEGGTALAEAIETAQKAFKEGDSYKVLVLFTDGEDHDERALRISKSAAEAGLRIFTIGIGSAEGEMLPDTVRDENGNRVKSRLNETLLQQIAGAANGFYLPMRGANTIDTLYQNGLAPLPKSESQEKWVKRARDRYHWPLAIAILLLIIEVFFPERKDARGNSKTKRAEVVGSRWANSNSVALMLAFACCAWANSALASPSTALRDYKSGKYNEALHEYERSLQKEKDDPRLHFNAGAAAYRNQQFDDAAKHLEKALTAPDLNLQQRAYYNLGNTLFHLGETSPDPSKKTAMWEDSLKNYQSSLKLNPQDADAKFNQEFVKRKLEELKQQQQQKQDSKQDQKQDDQKQDQQKQNESEKSKQDQQQKSDSQKPDQQQQDQQKQNSDQQKQQSDTDQKKEQQQQSSKGEEKKEQPKPDQSQQQKSPAQEKKDQEAAEEAEAAQSTPGQMTPQQAKQLLDAQKGDEMMLPAQPEQKTATQQKPLRDW
ncbi:MAG: VWA domain-containing protein [Verrucomicrobiota bacterium]